MNVVKIMFFLFTLSSFSQTKGKDVYFILNPKSKNYLLLLNGRKAKDINNTKMLSHFSLVNIESYNQIQRKINNDKEDGSFISMMNYKKPISLEFQKYHHKRTILVDSLYLEGKKIVDFNWLEKNSWKDNQKNMKYENLFFILKVEENKYVKFNIYRTLIAQ